MLKEIDFIMKLYISIMFLIIIISYFTLTFLIEKNKTINGNMLY
jgi:hypothetical protein